MITIEIFFLLAAAVVLIGLIVWRRDVKAGRVLRTSMRGPVTVMRERFAGRSAAAAPPPAATAAAPAKPPPVNPPGPDAGEGHGG